MSSIDHVRAPAKLTRSLRVVGVRHDGYHLLEAEMATIDLADELEIEDGADGLEVVDEVGWVLGDRPLSVGRRRHVADPAPDAVPLGMENLVVRALATVGRRARVRLRKRVPAGAGLGGGSSDAAAVLRWAGVLDPAVAAALGADVPFCVVGGRALVRGIGELVEPLGFEAFTAVLVTPALAVSTPDVYRAWDELGGPIGEHGNDLEPAAVVVEPRLAWWRDLISAVAGERPRLAGSGGTWYLERDPEVAAQLAVELQDAVRAERGQALVVAAASTAHP
jgi:4-diphosphocytidyl-2-C-methyl-D-erythritol kinase